MIDRVTHEPVVRAFVMEISNTPVRLRGENGRHRTVPLFEVLVERLAKGQTSRRTSPKKFIRLVLECASQAELSTQPLPPPELIDQPQEKIDYLLSVAMGGRIDDTLAEYLKERRDRDS